MKKLTIFIFALTLSCTFLIGCQKKEAAEPEATTMGTKLLQIFEKEIKKSSDLENIANTLSTSDACGLDCVVTEMIEGYFPGFNEEVRGFKKAISFSPMIGSIPFVGYLFEADNAEEFKNKLLSIADPRWNICTEAEETVAKTSGNYVFFAMCPGDDF